MAIELISCPACGTKNASQRTVCLRCGASMSTAAGTETTSVGWFKLLFKSFPEGCREAMRQSYQKHYDLARRGLAPTTSDPHRAGLFGALGTRYKVRGVLPNPAFPDVVLWPELAPFLLMSKEDSVEVLAEYVLWQERPSAARKEWLARKINEALRTDPSSEDSPRSLALLAFLNNVRWCELLYPGTKTILSREAEQLSQEGGGAINKEYKAKKTETLWASFTGKANTQEVLMEKAKALAPLLVEAAADTTKFIVAESRSHGTDYEDKLGVVFLETVFFYLHVTDRTACQVIGAEKKGTFFDALFFEVRERSSCLQESGIEASTLRDSFNEAFNIAQAEYAACNKIFPSEQGLGAAVFHLFSWKIVRILGVEKGEMIFTSVPNFPILGEPTLPRIVLALDIPALLAES